MNDICYTKDDTNKLSAYYMLGLMHKNNKEFDEMVANYERAISLYEGLYDKTEIELLKFIEECYTECIKFNMVNDTGKAVGQIEKVVGFYNDNSYFNDIEMYDDEDSYLAMTERKLSNLYDYACFMITVEKEKGVSIFNDLVERLLLLKDKEGFGFGRLLTLCQSKLSLDNLKIMTEESAKLLVFHNEDDKIRYMISLLEPSDQGTRIITGLTKLIMNKLETKINYIDQDFKEIESVFTYLCKSNQNKEALRLVTTFLNNIEITKCYRRLNPLYSIYESYIINMLTNGISINMISNIVKRYIELLSTSVNNFGTVRQQIIILYFNSLSKYEITNVKRYISIESYRSLEPLFAKAMRLRIMMKLYPKGNDKLADEIYNSIYETTDNKLTIKSTVIEGIDKNIIPMYIFLEQYIQVVSDKIDTFERRLFKYNTVSLFFSKRYRKRVHRFIELVELNTQLCLNMAVAVDKIDSVNLDIGLYANQVLRSMNILIIKNSIFQKKVNPTYSGTNKDELMGIIKNEQYPGHEETYSKLKNEINKYFK
jgi:hypothetical protein